MLKTWREEYIDNEELYQQLFDQQRLKNKISQIEGVNVLGPMKKMYLRIDNEKKRKQRTLIQWLSTVVAIFLLCFGLISLKTSRSTKETVAHQTILSSASKAILQLGNGIKIDLDTLDHPILQGNVYLIKTNQQKLSYETKRKNKQTVLAPMYNEIQVPRGNEFNMVLDDGTIVWLNADSKFSFPVEFIGKERKVYLEGEAYFKVKKNIERPFKVEVRGQTVEVLGTEFNITAYPDEDHVYTTLASGKISVQSATTALKLMPSEQSVLQLKNGNLNKRWVDVEKVISWKEGKFILEEQNLEQIMRQIARWYNMSVFYQDQELKNIIFKGVVPRYPKLSDVLQILEKTDEVKFSVQNHIIIIYK